MKIASKCLTFEEELICFIGKMKSKTIFYISNEEVAMYNMQKSRRYKELDGDRKDVRDYGYSYDFQL